ncbi:unnamed protein product [Caenorhabditis auriculariae]|uniref:Homeobox domain-containing protein n=1 Tax=Caenorhabditis auriculariae TaxID=2777116 RepID=A0A8S1H0G3_9PELO|nr:unnamed protein product [Caenorhabditis auriculariae]
MMLVLVPAHRWDATLQGAANLNPRLSRAHRAEALTTTSGDPSAGPSAEIGVLEGTRVLDHFTPAQSTVAACKGFSQEKERHEEVWDAAGDTSQQCPIFAPSFGSKDSNNRCTGNHKDRVQHRLLLLSDAQVAKQHVRNPRCHRSSPKSQSSALLRGDPMNDGYFAPPPYPCSEYYQQQFVAPHASVNSPLLPPLAQGHPPCFAMIYSIEQLEAICTTLYQAHDGNRLVALFHQVGTAEAWQNESILVAYIYALYHAGDFDRLFHILQTRPFSANRFKELQDIWYNARYKENEMKRGKELGAVEKYRLRRKYPPPKTIWDGEETVYSFKENSRKYLKQFYKQNKYPTMEQKREISRITQLQLVQISNWFKNRRQRDKPASKGSPDSSGSGNSEHFRSLLQHNLQAYAPLNMNMNAMNMHPC